MKSMSLLIALIFAMANIGHAAIIGDDTLKIGKPGSSANKVITIGSKVIRSNESTGKLEFSNDGSIYKKFGSGSGGGAGATTIIENGGYEDGVTSGWTSTASTVTAITGANALIGETSAQFDPTAQNDYFRTDYITVPKGLRGTACEARFKYTGSDRNVYAKVETESGVILGTFIYQDGANGIPAHTLPDYESVFFKCPTEADVTALATNGNIRLVLYQGTVTNAAPGIFDDVHFGGLIGLVESTTPDTFTANVFTAGSVANENTDWINGSCTVVGTGIYDCFFNSGIFTVTPSCSADYVYPNAGNQMIASVYDASVSNSTKVRVLITNDAAAPTSGPFKITCSKAGADAKQSVQVYKSIPKVSENINDFSATISATGVVSGENVDWINGNCPITTSPSTFTCGFISGLSSSAMNCSATPLINSWQANAQLLASSSSSVTVYTAREDASTPVPTAVGFTVKCQRSSDFKMPTVQPMVIGQVTNSVAESALNNVRVEGCKIINAGSPTFDTNSNMCSAWITSVNQDSGAGTARLVPKGNIFSANPVCSCSVELNGGTAAEVCRLRLASSGELYVATQSNAVYTNRDFHITCMGKR